MSKVSGFATPTVFILLTGLVMMTLYTSYVVYLQQCMRAHQRVKQKNNALIASAELSTKRFVIENWDRLQLAQGDSVVINDLFNPPTAEYQLVLYGWQSGDRNVHINYRLSHREALMAHKKMEIQKGAGDTHSWRTSHL